jgi:hypothetical protein
MAKKYFRNQTARHNYLVGLKSSFRRIFLKVKEKGHSQADVLHLRTKLLDNEGWKMLTANDQAEIFGYWEALSDTMRDSTRSYYLINGKFYTSTEVLDRKDGVEPSRDTDTKNHHFCYTGDDNQLHIWF